jgi:hypothetical protein
MSQKLLPLALLLVSAALTSPQAANETVPEVTGLDPSCACVAQGKRWAQGEVACFAGQQMVCGMSQNVTTWKTLGQPCQTSSLSRVGQNFTAM